MFSKTKTMQSIKSSSDKIELLYEKVEIADAILIGAGAGLSAAAGHLYSGERFENNFGDFKKKYGIHDMYSGGFYPYDSLEEYWAWWSRHIMLNRYTEQKSELHKRLLGLVQGIKITLCLLPMLTTCFKAMALTRKDCSIPKAITGCFNVQRLVTPTPTIISNKLDK